MRAKAVRRRRHTDASALAPWVEAMEPRLLLATISGIIYIDENGNGTYDGGDRPFSDTSVFVDTNNNGVADSGERHAVIDAGARYTFTNLPAGTHNVRLAKWTGYGTTEPPDNAYAHVVTVTADQVVNDRNFGLVRLTSGTVTGAVWHDRDGDRQRDATDTPLAGWTVFLEKGNNGVIDPGERSAVTAADGTFRFDNVPVGIYRLTEVVPAGWRTYLADPLEAGTLPHREIYVAGGETLNVDFFNAPFQRTPFLDPTFGVGGEVPVDSQPMAVEPAPGGGFFLLDFNHLHKLRDDGSPDTTFGSNGTVGRSNPWYYGRLIVDAAGRPVVAEGTTTGATVTRYTTAGAFDTSFGVGGRATVPGGARFDVKDLALTPTNKLVLFGDQSGRPTLVRLDERGVLDGTLNNGAGAVAVAGGDGAASVAIGPGEKIVVAMLRYGTLGPVIHRLDPDGTPDESFASGGALALLNSGFPVPSIHGVFDLHVLPDGKILFAADRTQGFHVVRLTSGGAADSTFGGGDALANATFTRGSPAQAAQAYGHFLRVDGQGRIVVAGLVYVTMFGQFEPGFARFLPDGTLDANFGDSGRIVAPFTWYEEGIAGTFVDADGSIVASLPVYTRGQAHRVVRFLPQRAAQNVGGVVYNDLDEDGAIEAGEPGVGGVTVYLDADDDGRLDAGEQRAVTNAHGGYALVAAAGTRRIRVVMPQQGWAATQPAAGAARTVTVATGQQLLDVNFGLSDLVRPSMTGREVVATPGSATPFEVRVRFDEHVGRSIAAEDFRLRNLTTGAEVTSGYSVTYDAVTHTAAVRVPAGPHGAYRLTLLTGGITDLSGNALSGDDPERPVAHLVYSVGGNGADQWTIDKTVAGDVQVTRTGGGGTHAPLLLPAHLLDALVIEGGINSDTFTIDLTNGIPFAAAGAVRLAGGADADVLQVIGSGGTDVARFSDVDLKLAGDDGDGGGGPEVAVALSEFETRRFDGRGGGDMLDVTRAALILPGDQRLRFLHLKDAAQVTLNPAGTGPLVTRDLLLAENARLWLAHGDLVVHAAPPERDRMLSDIVAGIARAAQTGNARGIVAPATAVASLAATINPGLATFDGVGVDENAILVKYTYNGDANLDGRVNADDYFRIDQGFLSQPSDPTYGQGDFNYDGRINADDYFLIDQAFLGQGGVMTAGGDSSPLSATTDPAGEDAGRRTTRARGGRDRDLLLGRPAASRLRRR